MTVCRVVHSANRGKQQPLIMTGGKPGLPDRPNTRKRLNALGFEFGSQIGRQGTLSLHNRFHLFIRIKHPQTNEELNVSRTLTEMGRLDCFKSDGIRLPMPQTDEQGQRCWFVPKSSQLASNTGWPESWL